MLDEASRAIVNAKIKTPEELARLIGPRPRPQRVIMCHGTFDIVHPGHIRHLLYAASKGEVLVASVTADVHITKGTFRPYVPEDLRAFNLAALSMVDYVVIDRDPTPLRNIAIIQPDLFAKGYEYVRDGLHPKTQDEKAAVEAYGGEVLFTPGDIVYSSTHLLNLKAPNLKLEKLLWLMHGEAIGFDALRRAVHDLSGAAVHVVGDTIVDSYSYCDVIGGVTKTPTLSVRFERREDFVGGAGIVAKHLKAAGADVTFSTVLGDDALKDFVLDDLEAAGVKVRAIIDPSRPTTHKNYILGGGYRLLKIDTLDNRSISDKLVRTLQEHLAETRAQAVICSDFRHGIFNRITIPSLIAAIPAGRLRVADSQVASRWGNILEFEGFDLITPNEREARFALADQDSAVRPLASALFEKSRCRTLLLKLGERGILTHRTRAEGDPRALIALDSLAERAVDTVGAGDALLAYATLALAVTGHDEAMASILGTIASGLECGLDGNVPISGEDMLARIDDLERDAAFGDR